MIYPPVATYRPWSRPMLVALCVALAVPAHVSAFSVNTCPNLGPVGQCVRVLSDEGWQPWSTGIPTLRLVTRPAASPPWGSVIPGTTARWVYAHDFNTGPARDPRQWSHRRFERVLGPGTPRYNVERAIIRITADNGYVLFVNGSRIGWTFDDVRKEFLPSADWRRYQTYDVTSALISQGSNVIMVDVYDYGVAAGFLLDGEIWCQTGKTCSAN
jgi:hypothetical protein